MTMTFTSFEPEDLRPTRTSVQRGGNSCKEPLIIYPSSYTPHHVPHYVYPHGSPVHRSLSMYIVSVAQHCLEGQVEVSIQSASLRLTSHPHSCIVITLVRRTCRTSLQFGFSVWKVNWCDIRISFCNTPPERSALPMVLKARLS